MAILSRFDHDALGLKVARTWTETHPLYMYVCMCALTPPPADRPSWPEPCRPCLESGKDCVIKPLTHGTQKDWYKVEYRCQTCSACDPPLFCSTMCGRSGRWQYLWQSYGAFVPVKGEDSKPAYAPARDHAVVRPKHSYISAYF